MIVASPPISAACLDLALCVQPCHQPLVWQRKTGMQQAYAKLEAVRQHRILHGDGMGAPSELEGPSS